MRFRGGIALTASLKSKVPRRCQTQEDADAMPMDFGKGQRWKRGAAALSSGVSWCVYIHFCMIRLVKWQIFGEALPSNHGSKISW